MKILGTLLVNQLVGIRNKNAGFNYLRSGKVCRDRNRGQCFAWNQFGQDTDLHFGELIITRIRSLYIYLIKLKNGI